MPADLPDPAATLWSQWLLGLVGAVAVLLLSWWRQLHTRDATSVDLAWSALIGMLGVVYAMLGAGSPLQRLLGGTVVAAWSLRLSLHLLRDRVLRGAGEDGRYRAMRQHFGERAALHFLWLYLLQAVVAAVFATPFLLLAQCELPGLVPVQWAGLLLAGSGLAIEAIADAQLADHRKDPGNRGRTCRRGLWRYSRHPNYFGEWLVWCGFAMLALPAPHGPWALTAPALMFVLVRFVSGVPFSEQQALRSRGDDYRAYIATTNTFFPGPPRQVAPSSLQR